MTMPHQQAQPRASRTYLATGIQGSELVVKLPERKTTFGYAHPSAKWAPVYPEEGGAGGATLDEKDNLSS